MTRPSPSNLLAACEFLAQQGIYGLVWLDDDLSPLHRIGPVVDFVEPDQPITQTITALMGRDEEIRDLSKGATGPVSITDVRLDPAHRTGDRINLGVYWTGPQTGYLLLVSKSISRSEIEVVLAAQVRARAIAEADAAAKGRIIARTNDELSRANQDLAQFAYVISHDLQSPLRALRLLTGDASRAAALGDLHQTDILLKHAQRQARRMSAMLSGLLAYSKIGTKTDIIEEVDTKALVAEIADTLERPAGIRIAITGDWPVIETLSQPLDIVLRNLIDNAIKHHDRKDGRIVLDARGSTDQWIFTVNDDGPGIPKEWQEAIFEPFKTVLDPDDEDANGSGIGLALVRKTIERFGARIELVSDPSLSRGTTFRVHWPKHMERPGPSLATPPMPVSSLEYKS